MRHVYLYVTNVCLFVALYFLSIVANILIAFGSDGKLKNTEWPLFGVLVAIHLVVNMIVIAKPKTYKQAEIIFSYIFILAIYGLVIYRAI